MTATDPVFVSIDIVSVCMYCKREYNRKPMWSSRESRDRALASNPVMVERMEADPRSHGICPECMRVKDAEWFGTGGALAGMKGETKCTARV